MNLQKSLYEVPDTAKSYADDIFHVDLQDIPWERVPKIKEVMRTSSNTYDVLMAARVLASWGEEDGFKFLESYVCDQDPLVQVIMPQRLHGYEEIYTQVLAALIKYWAIKSDSGLEILAREKIFKPIKHIMLLAGIMPFEIYKIELLLNEGYNEYIPLLKAHLETIIKNPKFHHWKVADCAHLLMKIDPEFVKDTLAQHGYTLADFPNK